MNGLVLDTSALRQYASGKSIEPGLMLTLAEEDASQQVWLPSVCVAQAHRELAGSPAGDRLDVLLGGSPDIEVAILDASTARRIAGISAAIDVGLDVSHAIATARLSRCYLVTAAPSTVEAVPGLDLLDISEGWD